MGSKVVEKRIEQHPDTAIKELKMVGLEKKPLMPEDWSEIIHHFSLISRIPLAPKSMNKLRDLEMGKSRTTFSFFML